MAFGNIDSSVFAKRPHAAFCLHPISIIQRRYRSVRLPQRNSDNVTSEPISNLQLEVPEWFVQAPPVS
jgi:hypothetical protein